MTEERPGMRIGIHLPNFGAFAAPADVADLARRAERAGWDGVFVWDHVVRKEGDLDVADPWVLLAAMAAATDRIRIGPLVTPLPRRRPWNVAKAAVTLDHLSGGRMVLGVGLGTPRGPEFTAFGEEADPRIRGDLLDEGVAIVRAAWTGQPVHHEGRYTVDGMRFLPVPRQAGGIPLWAAVESLRGRAVRRAATMDGVMPIGIEPDDVATLRAEIGRHRPSLEGYDVITAGTEGPGRWEGSGLTWWLRVLAWDEPLAAALDEVDAGPH